jgi:ATP-binding cassette, subfamily C (CFTR/MRP), member 1
LFAKISLCSSSIDTFNIITEIIIITSGARYVAAIIPFCMFALYFVQAFYLRTSRQLRHLDLEAKSPLYTHFTETLSGLVTIRAMGWKQGFIEENNQRLNKSQVPFHLVFRVQVWLNIVLDFFVCFIATVLVAVAVLTRDSTSKAAIGLALLNIISFNNTLGFLINSWTSLETSLGAVARLRDFLLKIPEEALEIERQEPPLEWPTRGDIEFDNVTSSYGYTFPLSFSLRRANMAIQPWHLSCNQKSVSTYQGWAEGRHMW